MSDPGFPTEGRVAFWVTNPCRITRNVKQMKDVRMYIEEFILVDVVTLLYKLEHGYALEML